MSSMTVERTLATAAQTDAPSTDVVDPVEAAVRAALNELPEIEREALCSEWGVDGPELPVLVTARWLDLSVHEVWAAQARALEMLGFTLLTRHLTFPAAAPPDVATPGSTSADAKA